MSRQLPYTQGDPTGMTAEQLHEASVRQILDWLTQRRISSENAEVMLRAMTEIAEEEGYGRR
jgi:hypothetical protein